MKRLILMRHAKSDWSGALTSDHDRPLNGRGRRSAAALGDWLRSENLIPDEVLCSSAMRTRETFVRLDLPQAIPAHFERGLYLASEDQILDRLQRATGDVVLMIGHNPGIAFCAQGIVASHPDHPQFNKYPTGATLVADFDIAHWADARWKNANARHFTVPRDLET
ncbi:SixA phosphatase family protein [Sulfitobacter sp. JB4-11]|uniref:SixA phosphatase family protein n=1 Tax=Sulfitobacter rhodophyticola TaxID=3238304 RepID=UPI00351786BA